MYVQLLPLLEFKDMLLYLLPVSSLLLLDAKLPLLKLLNKLVRLLFELILLMLSLFSLFLHLLKSCFTILLKVWKVGAELVSQSTALPCLLRQGRSFWFVMYSGLYPCVMTTYLSVNWV